MTFGLMANVTIVFKQMIVIQINFEWYHFSLIWPMLGCRSKLIIYCLQQKIYTQNVDSKFNKILDDVQTIPGYVTKCWEILYIPVWIYNIKMEWKYDQIWVLWTSRKFFFYFSFLGTVMTLSQTSMQSKSLRNAGNFLENEFGKNETYFYIKMLFSYWDRKLKILY